MVAGRLRETPWGNADKGGIDRSVIADLLGCACVVPIDRVVRTRDRG